MIPFRPYFSILRLYSHFRTLLENEGESWKNFSDKLFDFNAKFLHFLAGCICANFKVAKTAFHAYFLSEISKYFCFLAPVSFLRRSFLNHFRLSFLFFSSVNFCSVLTYFFHNSRPLWAFFSFPTKKTFLNCPALKNNLLYLHFKGPSKKICLAKIQNSFRFHCTTITLFSPVFSIIQAIIIKSESCSKLFFYFVHSTFGPC